MMDTGAPDGGVLHKSKWEAEPAESKKQWAAHASAQYQADRRLFLLAKCPQEELLVREEWRIRGRPAVLVHYVGDEAAMVQVLPPPIADRTWRDVQGRWGVLLLHV